MNEEQFLKNNNGRNVFAYLTNGVKLQGQLILSDDDVSIFLKRDGITQIVYIHAISTILPAQQGGNYDYDDPRNNGGEW